MSKLEKLIEQKLSHLEADYRTDKQAEKFAEKLAKLDEKILLEQEKR